MLKEINARIINKHATEEQWDVSSLVPFDGELIIYDEDASYGYKRIKIGDGKTSPKMLPFMVTDAFIDYNQLKFDTTEIVIGTSINTSAILGQSILGQMILR